MANLFDVLKTYRPRRVIQSDDFNDLSGAVKASFQKLGDAPASGEKGVSTAFTVGTPTLSNHAVPKSVMDNAETGVLANKTATDAAAAAALASQNAAASSATASASSAADSSSSAGASASSSTSSATAQTAAETAKTGAETAQAAAVTAKVASETAQTAAELAETNAEAAEAIVSASTSNSAASAAASASSAAASTTSAAAALVSQNAAAASYDDFDDRYLGNKASDPSVDNDGGSLITGAIYYNTSTSSMRVYGGSSWANVAPTATSVTMSQISDFPSQTDNAGKFLKTNGSVTSWGTVAAGGGSTSFASADASLPYNAIETATTVLPSDTTLSGTWEVFGTNTLHVVAPTTINSTGDSFIEQSQVLTGSHIFYKLGTIATYGTLTVNSGVILQGVGEAPAPGESSSGGGTVDTFRSFGELLYFANA